MAVPSKRTATLTLAFVAALGLWLALSGRRPPAGSPKPQLLYSAIAVASAAVAPPGCTASPSVCGDTLVCGGRWFVWQEGARSETECTRALGELLYGVDQLAAAPMAAAQSEPCSHAIALAKQSRPSRSSRTDAL
jgi:hypothetical protein